MQCRSHIDNGWRVYGYGLRVSVHVVKREIGVLLVDGTTHDVAHLFDDMHRKHFCRWKSNVTTSVTDITQDLSTSIAV